MTAVGTGVLVGTALIVIIPEGVETLYAARSVVHSHTTRSITLNARAVPAWTPLSNPEFEAPALLRRAEPLHIHIARQGEHKLTGPDDGQPDDATTDIDLASMTSSPGKKEQHNHTDWEPHTWVGISLIMGFILMYLIDKVPRYASGASTPRPSYVSLNRFTLRRTSAQNEEGGTEEDNFAPPEAAAQSSRPSSTTVGLVIHAAADGIALGASSAASSKRLGFIVFFALMIHKAPAAFGLTSALLKQGLSKRRARTHLIVFSLAAPTGALLTWAAVNAFGGGRFSGEEGMAFATGVLLLFSGGTFM